MHELLTQRLSAMCQRWLDLVDALPEDALSQRLPVASNSIGGQLWCVIGARESYARAIAAGSWQGFACSLSGEDAKSQAALRAALHSCADAALKVLGEVDWTRAREDLLLALLEHEAQHQGQLIRYVYGLGYSFPESWKQRWALS